MPLLQRTERSHTLARRDDDAADIAPVISVVGLVILIALISWIRVVRARERRLFKKNTYMAAANPIGRVRRYEPGPSEPRRPRTPPALRPRNENTYVCRLEPVRKAKRTVDSVQPTPPLYQSQAPTPERAGSLANVPIAEVPVIPEDISQITSLDQPLAHNRPTSTQEPPPPYNPGSQ